ncbi:MAG: G1 family glutamic endopeptidase [Vulcanimicrobiaceae bacterium]
MLRALVYLTSSVLFLSGVASATTLRSANTWSGYVVKGATFRSVTARWIQPTATCPVAGARASFWVGFDGFGDGTVEQVGTIAECSVSGGAVVYKAWWEMVASTGNRGSENFAVAPGDSIDASVRYTGAGYRLEVRDVTSGRHFVVLKTCTTVCQRSMAEWIVERPGSGKYPLADYGTITFRDAKAAGTGPPQGISAFPDVIRISMVHAGTTLSTASRIAAGTGGTIFRCKWHAGE